MPSDQPTAQVAEEPPINEGTLAPADLVQIYAALDRFMANVHARVGWTVPPQAPSELLWGAEPL